MKLDIDTFRYSKLIEEYNAGNYWGLSAGINFHNANDILIRNPKYIKEFIVELCHFIEMKRYGQPIVVNFGEDEKVAGYSAMQLIETSTITAHFVNKDNNFYLDIFSCKLYDPLMTANFCANLFSAKFGDIFYELRSRKL